MNIAWKGPDGTGCLYANVWINDKGSLVNIQLPQNHAIWNEYGVLKACREHAHPTLYRATVDGENVGDYATAAEATKEIIRFLTDDPLDDFNYVGSRHHY
jgi:hypothetical protein